MEAHHRSVGPDTEKSPQEGGYYKKRLGWLKKFVGLKNIYFINRTGSTYGLILTNFGGHFCKKMAESLEPQNFFGTLQNIFRAT